MKVVQPRFIRENGMFWKTDNSKYSESLSGANFEKILFWHLLYSIDEMVAVFVLNPSDAFRLVFGVESLCRAMRKSRETSQGVNISESMPALTPLKLKQLWSEVCKSGSAVMETDLPMESGQTMAAVILFYLLEFSGRKMMVGYLRDMRQARLTENTLHQLQCLLENIALGEEMSCIFEKIALSVESSKPGSHCSVLLLNEARTAFQVAAAPSFPEPYRANPNDLASAEECGHCNGCGALVLRGKRFIQADIRASSCWSSCRPFIAGLGAAACWSEPFFSATRQLLGVIRVYFNRRGVPNDNDLALLHQAANLSAIVIERDSIGKNMAHHLDEGEGSHHRNVIIGRLHEEAKRCRRHGLNLVLLFVNLDHFKEINAALGFHLGDQLLVQAESRIRNSVRDSDIVARLTGDDFVVIIPPHKGNVNAGLIGEHIVEALNKPFQLEHTIAHVSASVGIACYPDDAEDIDQLLDYADQSMYTVKKAGRSGVNFFTRSQHREVQDSLQLHNDLRDALQAGQFKVYYQPIVSIDKPRVEKAEALLRWQHPRRGDVSPDQFIPIAEEIGAIHEIGDWVFHQAAEVAILWQKACSTSLGRDGAIQVSVNMSPLQFMLGSPDVLWLDHLQTIGLNPKAMVIEITEGSLLNDRVDVMNKLQNFRQSGMEIAMDDFGTGYSAMAYLKKFDIHYLKIDRSFVRDLESNAGDRAIAEAIVVMAHRLGLKVIAEGVETRGQRDLLAEMACDYVQGYLYAKPMSAEEFLNFVTQPEPLHPFVG